MSGAQRGLVPIGSIVPDAAAVAAGSRAYQIAVARQDVDRARAVLSQAPSAARISFYPAEER